MERGLIAWYEELVETLVARLGDVPPEKLAGIAALAMEIRGFGPVKDEAVARVKAEVGKRMAELDAPVPAMREPVAA